MREHNNQSSPRTFLEAAKKGAKSLSESLQE